MYRDREGDDPGVNGICARLLTDQEERERDRKKKGLMRNEIFFTQAGLHGIETLSLSLSLSLSFSFPPLLSV